MGDVGAALGWTLAAIALAFALGAAYELRRRRGLALDDFAAARSGRRQTDRTEPVEVAELLEEQFDSWYAVAGVFDSHVTLGAILPGATISGDRLRLAQ